MVGLVEPNRGLVELYRSADVLNSAIGELEEVGAATVRVDAGSWTAESALGELARALSFPDYFGNNLDALADCLSDVIGGAYGYPAATGTRLLAIYQFDSFMRTAPGRAGPVVDILYDTAIMALKLGRPFLVLLQSDDPDLELPPVGANRIGWNQAEFLRSNRK